MELIQRAVVLKVFVERNIVGDLGIEQHGRLVGPTPRRRQDENSKRTGSKDRRFINGGEPGNVFDSVASAA